METTEGPAAVKEAAPEVDPSPDPPAAAPPAAKPVAETSTTPELTRRGAHFRARRWPRRALIATNIVVAVALIASVSAYAYIRWRVGQVNSVTLAHLAPVQRDPSAAPSPGGPPETILIVGSDTRANETASEAKHFGSATQVGGQRSDTIMLLRVDPATHQAHLLSIPRDLWVAIPGTRRHDRINTTFDTGPDLLVQTITQNLGIPINHYVEIDFQSFRGIVDAIHGVKVYFPTPAMDTYSGLSIAGPGCYNLDGSMALAYVRSRHYEYEIGRRWYFEAESDLARIRRQQDFVRKVMAKALASGLADPARLNTVISAVVNNVTVDSSLKHNQNDLVRVVKELKHLGAASLQTATLSTTPAVIGGGDVLLLKHPEAFLDLGSFLGTPPALPHDHPGTPGTGTLSPLPGLTAANVRVRVENGSGHTGQASAASAALQRAGFVVVGAGPADNYRYATSVVRYRAGDEAAAALLQSAVGGGAQLQADPSVRAGEIVLVTGASFSGVSTPASPVSGLATQAPATTTTTQPPLPATPANAPSC